MNSPLLLYLLLILLVVGEGFFILTLVKTLSQQPTSTRGTKYMDMLLTIGMLSGGMFLVGAILFAIKIGTWQIVVLAALQSIQWIALQVFRKLALRV